MLSLAAAPPPPPPSAAPAAPPPPLLARRMFVRLDAKGDAPPVVSYKKLCRDAEEAARQQGAVDGAVPPSAAAPGDAATAAVPSDDAAPSAASDDEDAEDEADDAQEGDEDSQGDDSGSRSSGGGGREAGDWYDLEDNFIDDSELMDAPEEEGKAKHNGFFINKGEIEREVDATGKLVSPPDPVKKRKVMGLTSEGPHAKVAKNVHGALQPGAPGGHVAAAQASGGAGPAGETKKPKAAGAGFQTTGPLADAVNELHEVVKKTPLPPGDQKRKALTPAMLEGLEKIKQRLVMHAELPRGLTSRLMEFMTPFAGISTLRRRLGQDRDDDKLQAVAPAAAVAVTLLPPPAPPAVAAAAPAAAPAAAAAAAPKVQRPVPSPAQAEADLARLRACVQARCALLDSHTAGAAGALPASGSAEGEEFQDNSFKWDRECEEALHVVVQNGLAVGVSSQHKSVFKDILARNIWPPGMVDAKTLKLAHTRVIKRRERAAGTSGAGRKAAAQPAAASLPGASPP